MANSQQQRMAKDKRKRKSCYICQQRESRLFAMCPCTSLHLECLPAFVLDSSNLQCPKCQDSKPRKIVFGLGLIVCLTVAWCMCMLMKTVLVAGICRITGIPPSFVYFEATLWTQFFSGLLITMGVTLGVPVVTADDWKNGAPAVSEVLATVISICVKGCVFLLVFVVTRRGMEFCFAKQKRSSQGTK